MHRLVSVSISGHFCRVESTEVTASLSSGCGSLNWPVHDSVLLDLHLTVIALQTLREGGVTLICRLRLDVIEI